MKEFFTILFMITIAATVLAACGSGGGDGGGGDGESTFSISVTVSGLTGAGLVLRNNGSDDLAISANGPFTFAKSLADGAKYNVTVKTQPIGQTCTVSQGSGTIAGTNVDSVRVVCSSQAYLISGVVSGLSGTVILRNNGQDELGLSSNGTFTFPMPAADGSTYEVTVFMQPSEGTPKINSTCLISNGTGTVAGADVTNVGVTCSPLYPLIISEYVEGSSSNKAVEIWSVASSTVDLQLCALRSYANGSTTVTASLALSGSLATDTGLVLCNSLITGTSACNVLTTSAVLQFNGDDALELVCDGITIDVFGQIGNDPGVGWGAGSETANHTLQRKCSISGGDTNGTDTFDPLTEWDVFAQDTFADLGSRCN